MSNVRCGTARYNYLAIGTERVSADGYLERKVSDDPKKRRWVGVHRLVWETAMGVIPNGMAVVFREGCRSVRVDKITPDRLELVTRQELMRRNNYYRTFPREVAELIQLKGVLNRKINSRSQA